MRFTAPSTYSWVESWFRVYIHDTKTPYSDSGFPTAPSLQLSLHHQRNSWFILQKALSHPLTGSNLMSTRFQVLFHSRGVLPFPPRYWFYRYWGVGVGGWSPRFKRVSRRTQDSTRHRFYLNPGSYSLLADLPMSFFYKI